MAGREVGKIMLLIHESRSTINDGNYVWTNTWDTPSKIHWEGTTIIYCDGHGKWVDFKELHRAQKLSDPPEWDVNPL